MTKEEAIVRSVFDAYIRDAKATSTKKDRPTFDMLEEVKNKAIKSLEQSSNETIKYLECNDIDTQKFTEAMKKQRLQVIKPNICDDCVSRTQAIEWIENLRQMDKCFGNYEDDYFPLSEVIDRLKNVPPVTPTHKVGYWDKTGGSFRCSECMHMPEFKDIRTLKYCPNCGADMRGVENGNK